jgi:uncharacterized protein
MKEIVIPIKGMHCRSCEITLTDNLEKIPSIKKADVNLRTKNATLYASEIPHMSTIKHVVQEAGYDIGYDKKPWFSENPADYKDVGIGIAVIGLLALIITQLGISDINTGSLVSGGLVVALIVGLTAGFSTCMALVGGLVLGLSARHAEKHPSATAIQKFRPHLYFNLSRIITFFILGGAIGALGASFQLQGSVLGILTISVGIVMLLLGLHLTNLFPRLRNGGLTLPSGIARKLGLRSRKEKEYSHKNAAILGSISFFLPCGFTQAMQLYAISTGSFTTGALVMGVFALGTMPGLLGIGGLTSVVQGEGAKRFFKIAGVAVVAMAVLNISNGYNLTGWQRPFVSSPQASRQPEALTSTPLTGQLEIPEKTDSSSKDNVLRASYTLASGMVPTSFTVDANKSYTLEVTALEDGEGCMSTILIPGLNNNTQYLLKGKTNKLAFKAKRTGVYQITCAMGVPHGKITVL